MIDELSRIIDGFLGKAMHVRCFDHSLNLMAKAHTLSGVMFLRSHSELNFL